MIRALGPVTLLALPLLAACGGGGSSGGGGPANPTVRVTLTDAGCNPAEIVVAAGSTVFAVSNPRTSKVQSFAILQSGRTVAQADNILGGLSQNVEVSLEPGSYVMRCRTGSAGADGTLRVSERGSVITSGR